MARFIEIKSMSPKLTPKEIAKELGYSTSSLQRYRQDTNMLSPYRIQPKVIKENKSFQIQSLMTIHIVNLTSKDLK